MSDFDVNVCAVPYSAPPAEVTQWSEDAAPDQPSSEDAAVPHEPEVLQAGLGGLTLPALAGTVSLGALDGGLAWGRMATAAEGLGTRLVTGVSVGMAAVGAFVLVLAVPARAGDPPEPSPPPAPPGSPGGGRSPDPDLPDLGPAVGGLLLQRALSERSRSDQSPPELPRDFESAGEPGRTAVGLPDVNGVVPPQPGFLPPVGQPPAGFLVLPPASHPNLQHDGRPRASAGKPPEDDAKASSADGTTNADDAGDKPGPAVDTDPAHGSLQRDIAREIVRRIESGALRPGDAIPVTALATAAHVTPRTVHLALDMLAPLGVRSATQPGASGRLETQLVSAPPGEGAALEATFDEWLAYGQVVPGRGAPAGDLVQGFAWVEAPRGRMPIDIARHLIDGLESGRFVAGDQLPLQRQLMQQMGVSSRSFPLGLQILAEVGVRIETREGRGTGLGAGPRLVLAAVPEGGWPQARAQLDLWLQRFVSAGDQARLAQADARLAAFHPIERPRRGDDYLLRLSALELVRGLQRGGFQPGDVLPKVPDLKDRLGVAPPVLADTLRLLRELGVSIEPEYVGGTRRSVLASLPPEWLADVAARLSDPRLKGVPPEQMPEVLASLRADTPLVQLLRRGESSGKPMLAHVLPFLEGEPLTGQAVAARLLHAMQAAGLGDGDLLPTYQELAEQFGVLPHWVQQGMAYLQGRGLVDAQQSRRGGMELVGAPAAAARLPVAREVFDRQLEALGNPLCQPEHRSAQAWAGYVRELGLSLGEDGRAPLGEALLAGTHDVQAARRQLDEMLLDLDNALAALAVHADRLQAKGLAQAASLERGQVADLRRLHQRVGELRDALAPQPELAPPSPAAVAQAREAMLSWLAASGVDARTADRLARGGDPTIAGTPLASPLQLPEHRGASALIGFLRTLGVDAADPLTHPDRVRDALLGTGTAAWRNAEIDRLQAEIAGTLPALQAHAQVLVDAGLPLAAARAQRDVEFLAGLSSKLAYLRDTGAP